MALKFPRTTHLFNLGSATRDDLRMSEQEAKQLLRNGVSKHQGLVLTAEEKMDGANLGLRWDMKDNKVMAQNRSFVLDPNAADIPLQFRQLKNWIMNHQNRLSTLLGDGDRALYGEWLALKHCIHYTRLTDYFLAFDILDLTQSCFLSRRLFKEELSQANEMGSGLYELPIFSVNEVPLEDHNLSLQGLKTLCLETQSQYYDGPVEGLYLRWDSGDRLSHRAKLVRPGFQQVLDNAGHWSKQIPVKNIIDFNKQYLDMNL